MQWFRVHNDIINNPKLRMLAFEDRWHYVALLALKSSGLLDKEDHLFRKKIAISLGVDTITLEEIERRLQDVGLIGENFQPSGWDARQYVSDSSTERVRKHRAKQFCNVSETPPDTKTYSDSDTELLLAKYDIQGEMAYRFIVWRKKKNAPIRESHIKALAKEARKAGITNREAVRIAVDNRWISFKAEYIQSNQVKEPRPIGEFLNNMRKAVE